MADRRAGEIDAQPTVIDERQHQNTRDARDPARCAGTETPLDTCAGRETDRDNAPGWYCLGAINLTKQTESGRRTGDDPEPATRARRRWTAESSRTALYRVLARLLGCVDVMPSTRDDRRGESQLGNSTENRTVHQER